MNKEHVFAYVKDEAPARFTNNLGSIPGLIQGAGNRSGDFKSHGKPLALRLGVREELTVLNLHLH